MLDLLVEKKILNGEGKTDKYIYIDEYPCNNKKINKYLLKHKNILIKRKIRKFNENNWFEWGAPRNIATINKNIGKKCIYIYNLTRKDNIAFLDNVKLFGGGLIILIPNNKFCDTFNSKELTLRLTNIISYFHSNEFKNNFMFSGRFKIGHRQISNCLIPSKYVLWYSS